MCYFCTPARHALNKEGLTRVLGNRWTCQKRLAERGTNKTLQRVQGEGHQEAVEICRSARFSVKIRRSRHSSQSSTSCHFVIKMMAHVSIVRHFHPSSWKEEERKAVKIPVQSFENIFIVLTRKNKDVTTTSFTRQQMKDPQINKISWNSASRLSFSRKSASGMSWEFRRSAEKLLQFRIPRQIFFEFRCSANPDDPHNKGLGNNVKDWKRLSFWTGRETVYFCNIVYWLFIPFLSILPFGSSFNKGRFCNTIASVALVHTSIQSD